MPEVKFYSVFIAILLVVIFAIQLISPAFEQALILNQSSIYQPWKFLTAIFLHGSLSHLLLNMFALILFGLMLEKLIGSNKFLLVFIITGILANIVSFNFYPSSLGASGAIMGVIGALAIIRPMMTVWAFGMIMPMFIAAIIYIVIDSIGIFIPDNIGHIAHLSGIFFGVIIGIYLRSKIQKEKRTHKIKVPEHIMRKWEAIYMD